MTAHASGRRVSEVCQLRMADLLGDRHQSHVVQAKGKNDCYTLRSVRLLEVVRRFCLHILPILPHRFVKIRQ